MGGDYRAIAAGHAPVDTRVGVAREVADRDVIGLGAGKVRGHRADEGIPHRTLLEEGRGGRIRLVVRVRIHALVESAERLLGIGATQLDRDPNRLPDLLIVERRYRDELGQLLTRALIGAAHASSRSRAA